MAPCPYVATCRPDGVPTEAVVASGRWYCPCIVRALLTAYAEVDAAGGRGGGGERVIVQGNRPAWIMQEEARVHRADVANALRALWRDAPAIAFAVAANHGLVQVGDHLAARRAGPGDPHPGRVVRASAAQLARAAGYSTRQERVIRAGKELPQWSGVDEFEERIAQGVRAMAEWLGWRPPGKEEE